jgi:deoxyribose-phosphate aldolase
VGGPAGDSRHGEDWRVQVARDAEHLVDRGAEEVDVRIQRLALKLACQVIPQLEG